MLRTYKVTASYTVFLETQIEAHNETSAWEVARNADASMFSAVNKDNWTISRVVEIESLLKSEHRPFAAAYHDFVDVRPSRLETDRMIADYFASIETGDSNPFIQKHGMPSYTSISDHWDMWRNKAAYEGDHHA